MTLEFLLVLPILLIVLLAVVEFGMFFANMQQVPLASRIGAETASETPGLPIVPGSVPANIMLEIGQQMATCGIDDYTVILQHNVGSPTTLTSTAGSGGACNAATVLPAIPARSVGVTICVPMTELAPNCLALFGFNLTGRCAKAATTFRYELSTP